MGLVVWWEPIRARILVSATIHHTSGTPRHGRLCSHYRALTETTATETHESSSLATTAGGVQAEVAPRQPQGRFSAVGDVAQAVPHIRPALCDQQRNEDNELGGIEQRDEDDYQRACQARKVDDRHHLPPLVEHVTELPLRAAEKAGGAHR